MIKASVDLLNTSINYIDPMDVNASTPKMYASLFPGENETQDSKTVEELKSTNPIASKLSTRNHRDTYIVPIEMEKVYINFIPRKQFVTDSDLDYVLDSQFEFFVEEPPTVEELPQYTLLDGTIYRITGNGFKDVKDYDYFVVNDGGIESLPNYKSVEVMLAEKGQIVDAIRVVTPSQHQDLLMNADIVALVKEGMPQEEAELIVSKGGGVLSGELVKG